MARTVLVESAVEIIAKKIKHRGAELKARDLFDLAIFVALEPDAARSLAPIVEERRSAVLQRLVEREVHLREDFAQLDVLGNPPSYDECVARVRAFFGAPRKSPPRKRRARR